MSKSEYESILAQIEIGSAMRDAISEDIYRLAVINSHRLPKDKIDMTPIANKLASIASDLIELSKRLQDISPGT